MSKQKITVADDEAAEGFAMDKEAMVDTGWVRRRVEDGVDIGPLMEAMLKVRVVVDGNALALDASEIAEPDTYIPTSVRVVPSGHGLWRALGPETRGTLVEQIACLVLMHTEPPPDSAVQNET